MLYQLPWAESRTVYCTGPVKRIDFGSTQLAGAMENAVPEVRT
jgi:hypothetical protein